MHTETFDQCRGDSMRSQIVLPVLFMTILVACGKQAATVPAPATTPAPAPAVVAAPAAEPAVATGEKVFKTTCSLCHQTGVAGAPMLGDKTDWGPRVAKGKGTLYEHALKGFTGAKGAMPAKGANPSLPDDDVKAAVDFMVSKAK
jgi:cytochrome c5